MSQKKQPKQPCKHVQELIEFALDNDIAIYANPPEFKMPENVRCYKCKRIFNIDTSQVMKNDGADYIWEEIFV